jgi:MarR family transcriptional regulator, organic hydroperoxide resistance regulator
MSCREFLDGRAAILTGVAPGGLIWPIAASTFHEMNSSSDLPDSSTLPESLRLLPLLWSLNAALQRTSLEMDARLGVTGPQRFLLRFVGLEPGITRARLASVILLDASELQSALEHLVARNLLTEKGGLSGYYLTAKGGGVNAVMTGTVEQAVSKALDEASPHERTSCRRMLERVIRHLKARDAAGKAP